MEAATTLADPPPGADVLADRLERNALRDEERRGPSLLLPTRYLMGGEGGENLLIFIFDCSLGMGCGKEKEKVSILERFPYFRGSRTVLWERKGVLIREVSSFQGWP